MCSSAAGNPSDSKPTIASGGCTRGRSPLVGGAAARDAPALFAGSARVAAWGEPARPGFPRRGNGKGAIHFLAAAGESVGHAALAGIAFVRQLRGPHLSTWPW